MMIQKSKFSYAFGEEAVTVFRTENTPNRQYISYNCYTLHSRKKFHKFQEVLKNSGPDEYNSYDEIYGLARRLQIPSSNGHAPIDVIDGKIAF